MSTIIKNVFITLFMLFIVVLFCPSTAFAANDIQIDGVFDDWDGQANVTDPLYDSLHSGDVIKFYWATNEDDENLYFMVERRGYQKIDDILPVTYRLNLDLSDNGIYHNGNDRYLLVTYNPLLNGFTTVSLYKGNAKIISVYSGNWGETAENGGRKCEFYASMDDLGIYPAQSLRMYLTSYHVLPVIIDRVPDTGDIQWSPIPILGKVGLGLLFVGGLVIAIVSMKKRKLT